MTVVFAAGGTGGHVYPALAIADALKERAARIAFIGTADRIEAQLVPRAGYTLHRIAAHALPRRPSLQIATALYRNFAGTLQSLRVLASERPDLVIATGGYVCFPVALATRIRRLLSRSRAPLVLIEPNAEPGLTTRLLAPMADEVWGVRDVGVPVRASLRTLPSQAEARRRLGLEPDLHTLVAIGGSQGARTINDAILRLVSDRAIPIGWQLFVLTGAGEYERIAAALAALPPTPGAVIRGYLDEMSDAYAAADLLLTRAGALTLAELAAVGKPAILVPYPYAAEGHQAANAAEVVGAGAAVLATDDELAGGSLGELLAATTAPARLDALAASARSRLTRDPLAEIVARVDGLAARKKPR